MIDWLEALILGVVQGFTEFLPVSSDGHLAVAQRLFSHFAGVKHSAADEVFFDVMLHVGTLTAIVLYYRAEWTRALHALFATPPSAGGDRPPSFATRTLRLIVEQSKSLLLPRRAATAHDATATDAAALDPRVVVRAVLLAGVATIPLVPDALFLKKWIDQSFQSMSTIGIGFWITAVTLLATSRLRANSLLRGGSKNAWTTTCLDALLIGIAQMFAPLPGVSRSGLTVAAALALGFSPAWAVGFSLLIACPAIGGAAVYELLKHMPHGLGIVEVVRVVAAASVAGVIGYLSISWLASVVRERRLWYFSIYLMILGTVVLAASAIVAESPREQAPTSTLDRPVRLELRRPTDRRHPRRPAATLARAERTCTPAHRTLA
ncbi:MAG: undecaprenyl-diphosphate phosphatase [Planctomycetota bacterium]|nr:undecaprenyl-diphosphate phosphatase [Planctomycetota bacterium]